MPSAKEVEAIKRKLKKEAENDHLDRAREAGLAAYASKSNAKIRKSQNSKAKRRDIFSKSTRLPGSGFGRNG